MEHRAQVLEGSFGLEQLTLRRQPTQEPGPYQVRLRLSAASLNYRDLMMVRGQYNPRQPLPLIPCSDGVGVVEAVGQGVTRVAVGQRVLPIFAQGWWAGSPTKANSAQTLGGPLDGTLRESMLVHEEGLVVAPAVLSDEEAACLPCAGVTAWSALVEQAQLKPGSSVLIQGTGGVSIFALQLAKVMGLRTIVTSSSDEKLERVRAMGADETINYKATPQWGKQVKALTDGLGVDLVVEVGGAGTLEQSIKSVKVSGQISLIGVLAGASEPLNVIPLLMQNIRVQGVFVGHRDGFEALNAAITQHKLRPVIDSTFALEDARAAFERLASGRHMGKICVRLG